MSNLSHRTQRRRAARAHRAAAERASELGRFQAFFDEMGVVYEVYRDSRNHRILDRETLARCHVLTAGQSHFLFDLDGRYLGVEQDEMGGFFPRRPATKQPATKDDDWDGPNRDPDGPDLMNEGDQ